MKKSFSIVMALLLVLCLLAACGQQSAPAPTQKPAAPAQEPAAPAQEPAAPPAPAEEPAAEDISYPEKPIEVVIAYGSGGDTDFNARAFFEGLSNELGVSVVGTNMSGSSGVLASRHVKDSQADGYTILFHHTGCFVAEMMGLADFTMLDDLNVACIAAASPGDCIVMRADSGIKTIKELIDYTTEHPDEIDAAIQLGTMTHIEGLQLTEAGAKINLIEMGDGSERTAALAGGHTDLTFLSYGVVKDYVDSGEFVVLGLIGTERSPSYPEVQTCLEQGYNILLEKLYFFAFPKDTDPAIVEKFAAAVERVVQDPAYQASVEAAYGQNPFFLGDGDGIERLREVRQVTFDYQSNLVG